MSGKVKSAMVRESIINKEVKDHLIKKFTDGLVILTSDTQVVYPNEKALKLLQVDSFSVQQVLENSLYKSSRLSDSWSLADVLNMSFLSTTNVYYKCSTKVDHDIKYFELASERFSTDKFKDLWMLHIRDASEKEELKANLRVQEALYKTVVENIPKTLLITLDKNMILKTVSGSKKLRMNGLENLVENMPLSYNSINVNLLPKEEIIKLGFEGKITQYEANLEGCFYLVKVVPISQGNGNAIEYVSIVIQDVTDESNYRSMLEDKIIELRKSNESLEEFAYVASHDLQEPLRKIVSFGERLSDKFGDQLGAKGNDYIQRMHSAANRMQKLIVGLLMYSRTAKGYLDEENVNLSDALADALSNLSVSIEEKNAEIVLNVEDNLSIKGDSTQIIQLFQNLISNSIKFSKKEIFPVVSISIQPFYGVREFLEVDNQLHTTKTIEVIVEDNGIGFNNIFKEKIFNIFQRLHGRNEYSGTGMGLAIAKKIVENHNGQISVDSEEMIGTRFRILFPLCDQ